MTSSRSGFYRRKDGVERLWLSPADIEATTEEALRKAALFPTAERPAVDIERFVEELGAQLDQYADLDATILGKTEFFEDRPPKISINRDLTGAIDQDETPQGIRGRWRATVAHEGGHVLFHGILFKVNAGQGKLFQVEQGQTGSLVRCLKRDVLFRGGGSDWQEVQANMAMAALLMPRHIFRDVARRIIGELSLGLADVMLGSRTAAKLVAKMSEKFDVSKQAAAIRLQTVEILSPAGQPLLADLTT